MADCFRVLKQLPKNCGDENDEENRHLCANCFWSPFAGIRASEFGELLPEMVKVPAGHFIMGSDQDEREYAYRLDEKVYGHL